MDKETGQSVTGFNQAIQGLRGIAILLVVANHAGAPGFGGGFVGVDIFFVISGYLIGGLLLRELSATGRIDIWAFYARRARRLLPACALVMLFLLVGVPILYAPFEHAELMSSIRASSLYAINLWLAGRATDYFAGHTEAIPVLHLWSLAVEEQFYIFWPLLMLGTVALFPRDRWRTILGLVVISSAISFAACVALTEIKFQWAFYLAPTRVWEFGAGMIIATKPPGSLQLARSSASILGWISLLTLLSVTTLFSPQLRFPGLWALVPVSAAAGLLILAEQRIETWPYRLLLLRPLRWLGDCSYSVYLWHWPLLIFASVLYPSLSIPVTASVVGLTLLVGGLSYRYIEQPFQHGWAPRWSSRRAIACALGVCATLAATAHLIGRIKLDADQSRFREASEWRAATASGCLVLFDAVDHPYCEFGSPASSAKATVVLFGDSHAMQWFTPLVDLAYKRAWRLIVLAKANCPPVDLVVEYYVTRSEYTQCTRWRENMFTRIKQTKPDIVITTSSSGIRDIPLERWQAGVGNTVRRLRAMGARVAYVRDTPFPNFDVPTCLSRAQWRSLPADSLCTYPLEREQRRYDEMARMESAAVTDQGGTYLDFPARICNVPNCPTEKDGVILFKDRNHITERFAMHLAPELESSLLILLEKR